MRVQQGHFAAVLVAAWVALIVGCRGGDELAPPAAAHRQADTGGCSLPSLVCGGVCRDLLSDRAHCGACGRTCAAGQVCSRGVCASACAPGLTTCTQDGSCHDLQNDPSHCGACGAVCGAGQVCDRGRCVTSCDPSRAICGRGSCRDLATDAYSCGACGRTCLAGEVCVAGACALPSVCALGSPASGTTVVDQSRLQSSAGAVVGATPATAAEQSFTVARAGFLSGVEVSLATCGGALDPSSTVRLTVRDELGQTLAVAYLPASSVANGTCPRTPDSLTLVTRGRALVDLGASCIAVAPGRRLTLALSAQGATTSGLCAGAGAARRCTNAPTVACTSAAHCARLPAIVRAGFDPMAVYAGGEARSGGASVAGALAFKTYVTPYATQCGGVASCDGVCRDLTSDRDHCGECGRECNGGRVCSAGVCATACGPGLATCGTGRSAWCANLQSDNLNCGACGAACAPGQVCVAGACTVTCGAGVTTCGRGPTAYCASTQTDNANCGACGRVCPAGQACSGGACATTCGATTTRCGGACVDVRNDPANCGACGAACGAGQVCSNGACGIACGAGQVTCGAGSLARCVDVQTDGANCGACGRLCPAGQVCSNGACALVCAGGTTRCGTGTSAWCTSTQTDNANCGGCGVVCAAGARCVAGRCDVTCGPGQTVCDGRCVDLGHDPANCGGCGRACAAGESCSMGACANACSAPDVTCGGRCVALAHDPSNCGACGHACPAAPPHALRACADATCGSFCAPGYGDCDLDAMNGCEADLRTAALHCGACGRRCSLAHATSACTTGACRVASCDAGYVDCDGDPMNGCELHEGESCGGSGYCALGHAICFEGQAGCAVDTIFMAGTSCRPAAGPCDVAETCDGAFPLCPPDAVVAASEARVCRAATGACDAIERCDGASGLCPADLAVPEGGACDDGNACTTGEVCRSGMCSNGAAVTCTESPCGGTRCDPTRGCLPKSDGTTCDDGDATTARDLCFEGACRGFATSDVVQVVGGARHTLVRTNDGSVWAMGANDSYQLGDGTTRDRAVPARVAGLTSIRHLAAGETMNLAVGSDGAAYLWGSAQLPNAGRVAQAVPLAIVPSGVTRVAVGRNHFLLLLQDGQVVSWGDNTYGQLGRSDPGDGMNLGAVPGLTGVVDVAAGFDFSVALTSAGEVWVWGQNGFGQTGTTPSITAPSPVRVAGLPAITSIAVGSSHVLARTASGSVWSWGRNDVGQLGDGTTTDRATPQPIASLANVRQVAAGFFHSLAVGAMGELWGWGDNNSGALGRAGARPLMPTRIPGVPSTTLAGVGDYASFAYTAAGADRKLWAFGAGDRGQLGDDSYGATPRDNPGTVVGFGRYESLVIEQSYDTRRTGANTRETTLRRSVVNTTNFGRLYARATDGQVLAQPLYVSGAWRGKDVIIAVTENNSVYVFADDAAVTAPIAQRNFGPGFDHNVARPGLPACTNNITGPTGITSTPALDLATRTLYFVALHAADIDHANPWFALHAVDMLDLSDRPGSPTEIRGAVQGSTSDAMLDAMMTSQVRFDPLRQLQRPGLLLQDGNIWIAFGAACDITPYHGWVMTYDARTLAQTGIFSATRRGGDPAAAWGNPVASTGSGGGIWQGGRGPASTGTGDVFLTTGNVFDIPSMLDESNFSNAVVRLRQGSGGISVSDWYMPDNWADLDGSDLDLASAGPTLIPGTSRLVTVGKSAEMFVLDANNLGHVRTLGAGDGTQRFAFPNSAPGIYVGTAHIGTVYWNSPAGGRLYLWPEELPLSAWALNATGTTPVNPVATTHATSTTYGAQRSNLALSANGSAPGTGILWATVPYCRGTLLAYDAEDIRVGPFWTSNDASSDVVGGYAQMTVPTVANGRVVVPTYNGLTVYGLLPAPRTSVPGPASCGCPTYTGPTPPHTWSAIYTRYFGPATSTGPTIGHCTNCHGGTTDAPHLPGFGCNAETMYNSLVRNNWITTYAPRSSRLIQLFPNPAEGSPGSPLVWIREGARMPRDIVSTFTCTPDPSDMAAVEYAHTASEAVAALRAFFDVDSLPTSMTAPSCGP